MGAREEVCRPLRIGLRHVDIYALRSVVPAEQLARLPYSIKVLLENLLRHQDDDLVTADDIAALAAWDGRSDGREIAFYPARVLTEDATGVAAIAELAAVRDAVAAMGGDRDDVRPRVPVDLVVDHSLVVDEYGQPESYVWNTDLDFDRNEERYRLLKWGSAVFHGLHVVPPDKGIANQINIEHLAQVVSVVDGVAWPDTMVGTDPQSSMVNGVGVLGWNVGSIRAAAAAVGLPVALRLPEVVGVRLTGAPAARVMPPDIVLTVVALLREAGVTGTMVEFFGPALGEVSVETRAAIAATSPAYGSICSLFPIDRDTMRYLRSTGRDAEQLNLVQGYAKEQGLWHEPAAPEPAYSRIVELDLGTVVTHRPHVLRPVTCDEATPAPVTASVVPVHTEEGDDFDMQDGHVVIAALSGCAATVNPEVVVAAGLVARRAVERGLTAKPWVKTSFAPGSRAVVDYLYHAHLLDYLSHLGFEIVGFGCTSCAGNAGPLLPEISAGIAAGDLDVYAVVSSHAGAEGSLHPEVRESFVVPPPLVIGYALAGTIAIDFNTEPIGVDRDGFPVFLRDVWPSQAEVEDSLRRAVSPYRIRRIYDSLFEGEQRWRSLEVPRGATYDWDCASTYISRPSYLDGTRRDTPSATDIVDARVLVVLGDHANTNDLSPAGAIPKDSAAGQWLLDHGVDVNGLDTYRARRAHEGVLARSQFSGPGIDNALVPRQPGMTRHWPDGDVMSVFEAAQRYQAAGVPSVVVAGRDYGCGPGFDWAAKGAALLGVRAVLAVDFCPAHRTGLADVGILPVQLPADVDPLALGVTHDTTVTIEGVADGAGGVARSATVRIGDTTFVADVCLDTDDERRSYLHGGMVRRMARSLAASERARRNDD